MLSVAVAVTSTLSTNIGERLHWLKVALEKVVHKNVGLRVRTSLTYTFDGTC